jgi:hypothetical protein
LAVPIDHYIAALEIAMDNVMFVCVTNGLGDLDAVFDYDVERKPDMGGDGMGEDLTLDKLHDNAGLARFFYYIFDPAYIGVVQRGSDSGFRIELAAGGFIGDRVFANQFDGDDARERGVPGSVNHTHAAYRHQLSELVAAEGSTR